MDEQHLSYRALADLTRAADPDGRGVSHAYLCALVATPRVPEPPRRDATARHQPPHLPRPLRRVPDRRAPRRRSTAATSDFRPPGAATSSSSTDGSAAHSSASSESNRRRFPTSGGPLAPACAVEVPVDGRAGHREKVSDLLDSVVASVVELLSKGNLLGVQPRPAATGAPASARGGQSVASVGEDQLALKLGQDGEASPNIARPSAVVVSMPCSVTCRPNPRARGARRRASRDARPSDPGGQAV